MLEQVLIIVGAAIFIVTIGIIILRRSIQGKLPLIPIAIGILFGAWIVYKVASGWLPQ